LKKNCKKPNVIDIGDFIMFGYENHSPLYINKSNGRIYAQEDTLTQRIDTIRLLRILDYYSLVEGFKRIQRHPRVIPFLEGKEKIMTRSLVSFLHLYSFSLKEGE
jgi:hypothetical protein